MTEPTAETVRQSVKYWLAETDDVLAAWHLGVLCASADLGVTPRTAFDIALAELKDEISVDDYLRGVALIDRLWP